MCFSLQGKKGNSWVSGKSFSIDLVQFSSRNVSQQRSSCTSQTFSDFWDFLSVLIFLSWFVKYVVFDIFNKLDNFFYIFSSLVRLFTVVLFVMSNLWVCVEGTEVATVKEWYQGRSDFLEEKEVDNINRITTERFRHGRKRHLLCKLAFCSRPQRRCVVTFFMLDLNTVQPKAPKIHLTNTSSCFILEIISLRKFDSANITARLRLNILGNTMAS